MKAGRRTLPCISNEVSKKNMPRAAEGLSIKAVVMKFLVKRKMRTVALIRRWKKITFSCDSAKASHFSRPYKLMRNLT